MKNARSSAEIIRNYPFKKVSLHKISSLVTGGAGFIGSHIAEWLLEDGSEVVILDDLSGGFKNNIPNGAKFVRGSVTDYQLLINVFEKYKFDYVFHLAAYAAEGLSHFIRRFNYNSNLIGSVNLINLSVLHNIKCFVFTSSIAVYGENQVPMTEEMIPTPEDPYGISKYAVELDLQAAKKLFGLNYIIFRPHNVYGERQNIGDKYRNVVGIFMNSILNGKSLTIFGDGGQTRAFTHIDDVAPIIARSIHYKKTYGEVFNIGGDKEYTIKELAEIVSKAMGVKAKIKYLKARKEVKHAFALHDKISKFMDVPKTVDLVDGVNRMVKWVKEHGARKSIDFENI